ncbi:MAG: ABC transporter permease [Armatimonadota bacterium]|nr:ABC transporter permease [Armatimonadota bacterium]MDR7518991.1 ABC transporter permease [Armatimonadota bacterium]MDR7548890.1 ABC transporter permease [Armatimonadota bacterium]
MARVLTRPTMEAVAAAPRMTRPGPWVWRAFRSSPTAVAGGVLLVVMIVLAALAPVIAPWDPQAQDLSRRLAAPTWLRGPHPLGTDAVGRDLLSNILFGLRISIVFGVLSIALSVVLGVTAGVTSGYYRGRVDAFFMRAADMQLSLPFLLVALAIAAIWGRGLYKLIIVVGVVGWAEFARTVRGSTLAIREKEFVEAARALGAADRRIMARHILPNVLTPVIVLISVAMPRVIVTEATLSFLGVGMPLTTPSLGLLIDNGYKYLFSGAWWPSIMPGMALMVLVVGINLVGDWLRDALDPRLHRRI